MASSDLDRLPVVEYRTLRAHSAALHCVQFSTDGNYLFTAGGDRRITLWNPFRAPVPGEEATGAYILQTYEGHGYEVMHVAVAPDNARFASVGGDKCAFLWDVATARVLRKYFGHSQRLTSCDFNEDGTLVFTSSYDKTVRIWDNKSASRVATSVLADAKDTVTRVVMNRYEIIASSLDGAVRTYDMRVGKCITDSMEHPISSFALTNDKACMLCASTVDSGALLLIDREGGKLLNTYTGHTNSAYRVMPCVTSDDSHVVCGSENGDVLFWDLVEAKVTHTLHAHKRVVSCVAHHPSPLVHVMATASFDGTCKIFTGKDTDVRALTLRHSDDD